MPKFQLKSFVNNFHFPEATGSKAADLNSLCIQKLAILAVTYFTVNTFLSSVNNDSKSTDFHVFEFLNLKGLHNLN